MFMVPCLPVFWQMQPRPQLETCSTLEQISQKAWMRLLFSIRALENFFTP